MDKLNPRIVMEIAFSLIPLADAPTWVKALWVEKELEARGLWRDDVFEMVRPFLVSPKDTPRSERPATAPVPEPAARPAEPKPEIVVTKHLLSTSEAEQIRSRKLEQDTLDEIYLRESAVEAELNVQSEPDDVQPTVAGDVNTEIDSPDSPDSPDEYSEPDDISLPDLWRSNLRIEDLTQEQAELASAMHIIAISTRLTGDPEPEPLDHAAPAQIETQPQEDKRVEPNRVSELAATFGAGQSAVVAWSESRRPEYEISREFETSRKLSRVARNSILNKMAPDVSTGRAVGRAGSTTVPAAPLASSVKHNSSPYSVRLDYKSASSDVHLWSEQRSPEQEIANQSSGTVAGKNAWRTESSIEQSAEPTVVPDRLSAIEDIQLETAPRPVLRKYVQPTVVQLESLVNVDDDMTPEGLAAVKEQSSEFVEQPAPAEIPLKLPLFTRPEWGLPVARQVEVPVIEAVVVEKAKAETKTVSPKRKATVAARRTKKSVVPATDSAKHVVEPIPAITLQPAPAETPLKLPLFTRPEWGLPVARQVEVPVIEAVVVEKPQAEAKVVSPKRKATVAARGTKKRVAPATDSAKHVVEPVPEIASQPAPPEIPLKLPLFTRPEWGLPVTRQVEIPVTEAVVVEKAKAEAKAISPKRKVKVVAKRTKQSVVPATDSAKHVVEPVPATASQHAPTETPLKLPLFTRPEWGLPVTRQVEVPVTEAVVVEKPQEKVKVAAPKRIAKTASKRSIKRTSSPVAGKSAADVRTETGRKVDIRKSEVAEQTKPEVSIKEINPAAGLAKPPAVPVVATQAAAGVLAKSGRKTATPKSKSVDQNVPVTPAAVDVPTSTSLKSPVAKSVTKRSAKTALPRVAVTTRQALEPTAVVEKARKLPTSSTSELAVTEPIATPVSAKTQEKTVTEKQRGKPARKPAEPIAIPVNAKVTEQLVAEKQQEKPARKSVDPIASKPAKSSKLTVAASSVGNPGKVANKIADKPVKNASSLKKTTATSHPASLKPVPATANKKKPTANVKRLNSATSATNRKRLKPAKSVATVQGSKSAQKSTKQKKAVPARLKARTPKTVSRKEREQVTFDVADAAGIADYFGLHIDSASSIDRGKLLFFDSVMKANEGDWEGSSERLQAALDSLGDSVQARIWRQAIEQSMKIHKKLGRPAA